MQLTTTFRHMDASHAVKRYAEERLERIKKFFHRDPISAHAIFAVEKEHNHMAEFLITLPNGVVMQARETTGDMYSSIDLAGARLERQVRKWKEKVRDHKPHGVLAIKGKGTSEDVAGTAAPRARKAPGAKTKEKREVVKRGERRSVDAVRAGRADRGPPVAPLAPAISVVREETFRVRSMRVDDAVGEMNMLGSDFFVFADVDSRAVSVVYRRKDGHYGLIETGAKSPGATA